MGTHQVLVIDDDVDIRDSLVDFLQDHGYAPVGAVHGRDALDKLNAPNLRPCAIILDLMMPVMDGKMFRQEQLRIPDLSRIPVIVISAQKNVAEAIEDLDIARSLPKPLNLSALLKVLREYCLPV
jgi:DNA-binding response OmpR family regulator